MSAPQEGNLIRKQYLVSSAQVDKLEKLAQSRGSSAAEIVRLAIDAYDPNGANDLDAPELLELVSRQLKEAIKSTKQANRKVDQTLKALDRSEQ